MTRVFAEKDMKRFAVIAFCFVCVMPPSLAAQKDGLVAKIQNPKEYFGDNRRDWVGKTIFFLRCEHVKYKNPYFDWYYHPSRPVRSKPKRDELLYKYGRIEEVWTGQFNIHKRGQRPYWRLGFFWKVRLLHNQRTIYFWDDNETRRFNFGFVEDFDAARKEIGRTFWSKDRDILYQFDDAGVVPLLNLEPVRLDSVAWGEYGTFPIKLVLSRKNGDTGYLLYRRFDGFVKDWYLDDPRKKFPYWKFRDWELIENRKLRTGMIPEMVMLSWGEPAEKRTVYDKDRSEAQIWTYEGVKETTYFLRFQNSRLKSVRWRD